jgi:23S rRNA pseudouridine1911/1915/1917 synthase
VTARTVQAPAELLPFLLAEWPEVKKKRIRTWLKFRAVTVNGIPVTQFNHPLRPGDVVAILTEQAPARKHEFDSGLHIVFEDDSLLVIDKPAGLLSIATESERERTAYHELTDYLRDAPTRRRERVWIVHRLDRETSGLMVFAKTAAAKSALQQGWDDVEKRYQAVVEGAPPAEHGTFESDLNEASPSRVFSAPSSERTRHAVTRYRVLAGGGARTLVELTLVTGRRHQIRVHLADAGCPVVGDTKYGARTDPVRRLALHAYRLAFRHPATQKLMSFDSPLPQDLARLVVPTSVRSRKRSPSEPQKR